MSILIRKAEATAAQPTPGPWQASQCDDGSWMVHTEGEIIALSDANTRGDPVHEPNARLMAAAPKMLEALERAREAVNAIVLSTRSISFDADLRAIDLAIEAAKGRMEAQ